MTPTPSRRPPRSPLRWLSAFALAALLGLVGCATPPGGHPGGAAGPSASAPAPANSTADTAVARSPVPLAGEAAAAMPVPGTGDSVARLPGDAPPLPIDPLRPDEAVMIDAAAHTDLWARVRRGFGMPDLANDHVLAQERWYASRPDYVRRMTERGSRYLFHIVEEVERRGMPTELALLPFIESAFNPQAMSSAKASGMWQFIPSTGKDFDLKQNLFRDDRRDVLASTRAALDYLGSLHQMFGDWHLALAAYNWGQGSVQRAINRNKAAGLPTDYQSLRMPEETRQYVPKLQAVKNIVAAPDAFGLSLPPLQNHPFFLAVPIERDIDVDIAARLAEMPLESFRQLNPQMNKPVILAAGTPQVLLPYDNAETFLRNLGRHHGPLATWTAWVAPRTMKPADAAKAVGMTEARLREVNRIPPRMLVKTGSTLLVPRAAHKAADVSEQVADNARMLLAPDVPPLKRVSFKAGKKGDSVAAVARRYRTSAAQVARWNGVSTKARFAPGTQVVVYVPPRAAKAPPKRTSAAKAKGKSAAASAKATGGRSTANRNVSRR